MLQAEALALLDERISSLELLFTQLRLDLKTAGILHDEDYTPEVTNLPPNSTKSARIQNLEKNDPFG